MRHTLVTYTVKPGREEENAALVRAVFEELAQTQPEDCGTRSSISQTRANSYTCTPTRAAQRACKGWPPSKPS